MDKKKVTIVTHSSKFHSDDIFGVATLLLVLGDTVDVSVIRSRDKEVTSVADYVLDTGGIYNPEINRFDHHQEGGAGKRDNGIPYASFGLIWKKYGEELCGSSVVSQHIDEILVQPIDAYDNGVELATANIENVYPFDLRSILYAFRPTWKEDTNLDDVFMQLVSWAQVLLLRQIRCDKDEQAAVDLVVQAYNDAKDKRLILLDERYPWEETLGKFPEPLFVIYPKRVDNTWSLKTIRGNLFSFVARKDLPQSWAGKFGEDLEKITGVPDLVFCHNNRFLAVAKTKESILKLAEIALNS